MKEFIGFKTSVNVTSSVGKVIILLEMSTDFYLIPFSANSYSKNVYYTIISAERNLNLHEDAFRRHIGIAKRKAKEVAKEDQKETFFHSLNRPLVIKDDGEALGQKEVNYIVDAGSR